jgi:predicted transport protein
MSWAKDESGTIALGDRRLNKRAVLLAERLGQQLGASIPGACGNWAETAAAYRFLSHDQVGWEEILSARAQASQARIREHAVVLCLQDTTELDYNGQAMSGLGPLKLYVAYRRLKNFVCMSLISKQDPHVFLTLKLDPTTVELEKGFARDVTNIGHWGTGDLEVVLRKLGDFEKVKPLIDRAYQEN